MLIKKYVLMVQSNERWAPATIDDSFSEYTCIVMGGVCSYFDTENMALKARDRIKRKDGIKIGMITMELR